MSYAGLEEKSTAKKPTVQLKRPEIPIERSRSERKPPTEVCVSPISKPDGYDESVKAITKILTYREDLLYAFGREGVDKINKTFSITKRDLDAITNNASVVSTVQDIDIVISTLNVISNTLLLKPWTPIIKDVGLHLNKLVFNWNKNICKNTQIETQSLMNLRMIQMQMTLTDLTEQAKFLINEAQRYKNYRPQAYELARHYLDVLDKHTKEMETKR